MKCIDFDRQFEQYTARWIKEHGKDYKNYDEMENAMPEVYEAFLETPAEWLGGAKPGEYYKECADARMLVDQMQEYLRQRVPLPDMLLNRIAELGGEAEERLMDLLKPKSSAEGRMTAVTLLRELGSEKPAGMYAEWQQTRGENDELCDNALESLESMGEAAYPAMMDALPLANDAGREALLSLLCRYPGDGRILDNMLDLFANCPERRAILACYLGRLGDASVLPALEAAAAAEDTEYLEYIEYRAAIEELGGCAPERNYENPDPRYEALRGKQ
jgi:hypothetical protein